MLIEIKYELEQLIKRIAQKNTYYGNKIPTSIMNMFEIEEKENSIGILVPYWISILEHGRGIRRSNKATGLWKKMYEWMQKRGMFRSTTAAGKLNEAKRMTWYINKYGTKHFRSKTFVDIYTSETQRTIDEIDKKYSLVIGKITSDVI